MVHDSILQYQDEFILAARMLLMALFLVTGYTKLTNFAATTAYMTSTGLPVPQVTAGCRPSSTTAAWDGPIPTTW